MSENITAPAKQAIGRLEILLQDPVLNDHGCTYLDGFVTQMNRSKELLELGDEWIKKKHTQETIDGYKERIDSQEKLFLAMEDWITRLIKALKEAEADGDEEKRIQILRQIRASE